MRADFRVVLDACVLAHYGLCDLFLRLAEEPRLFVPCWSRRILDEVQRTQRERLVPPWPNDISDKWRRAVEDAFPEAMTDHSSTTIESALTNDVGDRHVLATAIHAHAEMIVTFNLRHFPVDLLRAWKISAAHPSDYLITLYSIDSGIVVSKLEAISRKRSQSPEETLSRLSKSVPGFALHVANSLGLEITVSN
jgi:predicted nucleic acid-binding protein